MSSTGLKEPVQLLALVAFLLCFLLSCFLAYLLGFWVFAFLLSCFLVYLLTRLCSCAVAVLSDLCFLKQKFLFILGKGKQA